MIDDACQKRAWHNSVAWQIDPEIGIHDTDSALPATKMQHVRQAHAAANYLGKDTTYRCIENDFAGIFSTRKIPCSNAVAAVC